MPLHAWTVGRSVEGRRIRAFSTHRGPCEGLILGGVHGDEPKGAYVVNRLLEELRSNAGSASPPVALAPQVNPDALLSRTRRNANRVDINRNFPTLDWRPGSPRSRHYGGPAPLSEPETRAVVALVGRFRPRWIVTVHSIDGGRFCNNYDGPARRLAQLFARFNGYPVAASIGYPTPGSFGAWAGRQQRIAVLTLELPSAHSPQRCWRDNCDAFFALLKQGPRSRPS